jgi:3-methyladenine DNA glycosylase AlkD
MQAATSEATPKDPIQKAVGWMLREAGKADILRLEYYLRINGAIIPRTTMRYAIERMSRGSTKSASSHSGA